MVLPPPMLMNFWGTNFHKLFKVKSEKFTYVEYTVLKAMQVGESIIFHQDEYTENVSQKFIVMSKIKYHKIKLQNSGN